MSALKITGGYKLKGELSISGAKNAILPILAAALINSGISIIENSPHLADVEIMLDILISIGCKASLKNNTITIDSSEISSTELPGDLVQKMRASIVIMGALLGRFGEVKISYPGGCEIGLRPIDLHLKAFKQMGAEIHEIVHGYITCKANKLMGSEISLDYPSVGATENIMLAACFAEGVTTITNAAKEPEIEDLQEFLRKLGVRIKGAGSSTITIYGLNKRKGNISTQTNTFKKEICHKVIPDRIVAGTYLLAGAITGGTLTLTNVNPAHLSSVIYKLRDTTTEILIKNNSIKLKAPAHLKNIELVRTLPYPGFPTDMQPQLISMLSVAEGTSIIVETVFENRYRHVDQLIRMGAEILINDRTAVIKGVKRLSGADLTAHDLRGGAALVLAGLCADGETIINGIEYIDRGYESIENQLSSLGAVINRIN